MRATAIAALLTCSVFASGCAHVFSDEPIDDTQTITLAEPVEAQRPASTQADSRLTWGRTSVVPAGIRDPYPLAEADDPYLLDTGDQLRIFVYGEPNLSRLYIIGHDGKISVPLIGNVSARGKTVGSLKRVIASRLGARYVRDPQVSVDVQQNRPFYILGEVRSAGQYPFASGMTVRTAVAIAGGYTERADENSAKLTRRVNGFVEEIEATSSDVVRPGDTIYIRERFF